MTDQTTPSLPTLKANAESGLEWLSNFDHEVRQIRAYLDALERQAGTCHKCGDPVFHRPNKPGEYDHDCKRITKNIPSELRKELETWRQFYLDALDGLNRGCQEPTEIERLRHNMEAALHYWKELSENPDTDSVDINAAGKDYYVKQRAYDDARATKADTKPTLTFSDALRIARGCYRNIPQGMQDTNCNYGIQTVINALEAEQKKGKV